MFDPSFMSAGKMAAKAHVATTPMTGNEHIAAKGTFEAAKAAKVAAAKVVAAKSAAVASI
jgi:hypothetical protein